MQAQTSWIVGMDRAPCSRAWIGPSGIGAQRFHAQVRRGRCCCKKEEKTCKYMYALQLSSKSCIYGVSTRRSFACVSRYRNCVGIDCTSKRKIQLGRDLESNMLPRSMPSTRALFATYRTPFNATSRKTSNTCFMNALAKRKASGPSCIACSMTSFVAWHLGLFASCVSWHLGLLASCVARHLVPVASRVA
jgi:hypothetical protein